MAELKDYWKQTAKSFVLAINDLGVSLSESAKIGVDKAVQWARKDNPHYEAAQGVEVPTPDEEPAEETAQADEPAQAEAAEPAESQE